MSAGVIFRRIGGRIIPMLKRTAGDHMPANVARAAGIYGRRVAHEVRTRSIEVGGFSITGSVFGTGVGTSMAGRKNRESMVDFAEMQRKDTQIDTKETAAKYGVIGLTDRDDFVRAKLPEPYIRAAPYLFAQVERGNAFAFRNNGKNYIVAGKKASSAVIGHEIGHTIDYKKAGTSGKFERMFGGITGMTYAREERAWKSNPLGAKTATQQRIKNMALETYRRDRDYKQQGALQGFAGGFMFGVRRAFFRG